jgi:hypothetical protein
MAAVTARPDPSLHDPATVEDDDTVPAANRL